MTALTKHVILLVTSLILFGCSASRSFVTFEVLEPAPVLYPENVSTIGFLNRAPYSPDSYPNVEKTSMDKASMKIVDTIVVNNIFKGFKQGKEYSELTYLQDLSKYKYRRTDTVGKADQISDEIRNKLFSEHNLDAVISLEYFTINLYKSYIEYNFLAGEYLQEYVFESEVLWRVYMKDSILPIDEYLYTDTLYYANRQSMSPDTYVNASDVLLDGSV